MYKRIRVELRALTAFGSPILGESLFGQICWAVRERFGNDRLNALLEGYTENKPFIVVSDAFPSGYLPLPSRPSSLWTVGEEIDRKKLKARKWISVTDALELKLNDWQKNAKDDSSIKGGYRKVAIQDHNSLSRQTGTTLSNQMFAPYLTSQTWYSPSSTLDVYIEFDCDRISKDEIEKVLEDIGLVGYGANASVGLGKFMIQSSEFVNTNWENASCVMTLASSFPKDEQLDQANCYYQVKTHFGRHGNRLAQTENPFKKPLMLVCSGAFLTYKSVRQQGFIGMGIGNISNSVSGNNAVHQAYAPIFGLKV